MADLGPNFWTKEQKQKNPRKSGAGMGIMQNRGANFRVYLSKKAWTFGLVSVKMNKIRYFLEITWF